MQQSLTNIVLFSGCPFVSIDLGFQISSFSQIVHLCPLNSICVHCTPSVSIALHLCPLNSICIHWTWISNFVLFSGCPFASIELGSNPRNFHSHVHLNGSRLWRFCSVLFCKVTVLFCSILQRDSSPLVTESRDLNLWAQPPPFSFEVSFLSNP